LLFGLQIACGIQVIKRKVQDFSTTIEKMRFEEVIGQEQVKSRLIRSVKSGRISHAQLFTGPEGSGKLAMAIAFAQYVLCSDPSEADSCGSCPSCLKINKLAHPDLHFVFPVVNTSQSAGKSVSDHFISQWRKHIPENPYLSEKRWYEIIEADNKQGFISRNESNAVLKKLSLKSYESEYKIMIMWLAEKMNPPAANSLLKMIEEPPEKTLFLLISENTDQILPTILSRTQLLRLNAISEEHMRSGLLHRFPDSGSLIPDIIRRANGNFSLAIQYMESDERHQEYFEQFVQLMRKCYSRDIISMRKWTEETASWGRERIKDFLTFSVRMLRENFMLNLEQDEITYLSEKEMEFSRKFSAFIHQGNVFDLVSEFEEASAHIEANGLAKLVLFDLSIKIILLLKQKQAA